MYDIKREIKKYLYNKISLSDLNVYFRENVPFSQNSVIEEIRLEADIAVEGELTKEEKEDGLISEQEFKNNLLKKFIKKL